MFIYIKVHYIIYTLRYIVQNSPNVLPGCDPGLYIFESFHKIRDAVPPLIEAKEVESSDGNNSVDEEFWNLEKNVEKERKEDKWDEVIAESDHSDSEHSEIVPNSEDSEKGEECIDETFDRHIDWYIPNSNIKKSLALQVLYVIKDFLSDNCRKEPTRSEIQNKITELSDINPHFIEDIEELTWDKLRGITKSMWHLLWILCFTLNFNYLFCCYRESVCEYCL